MNGVTVGASTTTRIGRYRWWICALLFLASAINYIDRQVVGILKPTLQQQFAWSEVDYGYIVMAFQIAYAIGLVSAGRLIDRIGTRRGFALAVLIWSLAAMAHAAVLVYGPAVAALLGAGGLAVSSSVAGFIAARFALGLGSSTNLSDTYPWGLWILFDLVWIAVAAGAFAMAGVIYVLQRKDLYGLGRTAVLMGLLSYSFVMVTLLADMSTSIMQHLPEGGGRLVDRVRAGVLLFAESMEEVGDAYSIAGFCSKYRDNVSYYTIKGFDEPLTQDIRSQIGGMSGRPATRMGAAIRHATSSFSGVESRRRLLLILSDGRPEDYDDGGDRRYLHEDTRMAVKEAVARGVHPFCITVDTMANQYLPQIFGKGHYLVLDHRKRGNPPLEHDRDRTGDRHVGGGRGRPAGHQVGGRCAAPG